MARRLPQDMDEPAPGGRSSVQPVRVAGLDALQVWAPVDPIVSLGQIGVLFSQAGEQASPMSVQRELVAAIALIGMATIVGVYLFLRRSLAPLNRVVQFACGMGDAIGETLDRRGGSREVAALTEALNEASLRLQSQLVSIRDSEARNHTRLDVTPDAIPGLDAQARIVMINPAATGIFGVEPHQVLGASIETLLPRLTAAEVQRITCEGVLIRASRMARLDAAVLRREGTEFLVEVAISRAEDGQGTR